MFSPQLLQSWRRAGAPKLLRSYTKLASVAEHEASYAGPEVFEHSSGCCSQTVYQAKKSTFCSNGTCRDRPSGFVRREPRRQDHATKPGMLLDPAAGNASGLLRLSLEANDVFLQGGAFVHLVNVSPLALFMT